MEDKKISFFLMGYKGLYVLEEFIRTYGADAVAMVVSSEDRKVTRDYYREIREVCAGNNIPCYNKQDHPAVSTRYSFAVSWRWMSQKLESELIVLHDSILPYYRGFAPLVSMLINKEAEIGVTALLASGEYDMGDILAWSSIPVEYPVKISEAIDAITVCYWNCITQIYDQIRSGTMLKGKNQDPNSGSYSLWRDDEDYFIDWSLNAADIKRFIDATGFPYKGAASRIGSGVIRIWDAEVEADVRIENRTPGKLIFIKDGQPVITCGSGLLRVINATDDATGESALPFRNFRTRLT